MIKDNTELLEALDFNSVHSKDQVAQEYFRQAAEAIRALENQVNILFSARDKN